MKTNVTKMMFIIIAMLFISGCSMKSMMVEERVSPYDVDTTISKILENAKAIGWFSSKVRNVNKSINKQIGKDIGGPVRIVELCKAEYVVKLMTVDEGRYASVFMPCAITVYTKSDGKVYVTNMRAGLMGSMMGGVVAEIMEDVDVDQKNILAFLE